MSDVLRARSLSKWFGEVVALNDLDLTIEKGVTGILGPNGAGKSTFFKLALGLYRPSRGTMEVLGAPPRNNMAVLERIGYCPESDKFYENMTGYEFVYCLNRYWGMSAKVAEMAAEEACELVRMTERMDDPIEEYSKGMRQRIKIAQALTTKPELLILDEPMAGLDPQGREEMFALIRRSGDEGISVLVSSHILYEIERVTDNIVLIYNGTMLAQGRVKEIRDLIDEHPHTVTVECTDARAASILFAEDPSTVSIQYDETTMTLRTHEPNRCFQRLNELARDERIKISAMTCADDNLQSVFEYLVGK